MERKIEILVDTSVAVFMIPLIWRRRAVFVGETFPLLDALLELVVIRTRLGDDRFLAANHGSTDTRVRMHTGHRADVIAAHGARPVGVHHVWKRGRHLRHLLTCVRLRTRQTPIVTHHLFRRHVTVSKMKPGIINIAQQIDT